jgi:hypothetical protein
VTETLAEKTGTPCRGGVPPLGRDEALRFQAHSSERTGNLIEGSAKAANLEQRCYDSPSAITRMRFLVCTPTTSFAPPVVSFRRAHRRSRGPFIRRRTRALCTSPAIAEGRANPPCGPDRRSDVGRANIGRATPPIYPSVSFRQGHGAAAYLKRAVRVSYLDMSSVRRRRALLPRHHVVPGGDCYVPRETASTGWLIAPQ